VLKLRIKDPQGLGKLWVKAEIFLLSLFPVVPSNLLTRTYNLSTQPDLSGRERMFFQGTSTLEFGAVHRLLVAGLQQVILGSSLPPHLALPQHNTFHLPFASANPRTPKAPSA